jgi:hypothetical protein
MPSTPSPIPRKPKLKSSQVANALSQMETILAQFIASRRVLQTRRIDKARQAEYTHALRESHETLNQPFHTLFAYLREKDLPGLFDALNEVLERYVDDDE